MLRPWLLQIEVDREQQNKAIYTQIAEQIITLITNGVLKSNDILPSSREMAANLQVSRKSVVKALDILVIDGWLISVERVGIFVRDNISRNLEKATPIINEYDETHSRSIRLNINDGIPDSSIAPIIELSRAYRQYFNRAARWNILGYQNPKGENKFREEVSNMLNGNRGLQTTSAEICITRGSQMALFLTANAVLDRGDTIIIENPCYKKAEKTFINAGINVIYADVDREGVNVYQIEKILKKRTIKAIYITPQHQYPTTVTLSVERRLKLLELAIAYNLYIVEDDYDCDFHFADRIIMPLSRLLPKGNYIYIGSFSKIIAPSVRVGFIAADSNIINKIGDYRSVIDVQGDSVMEQAILELIKSGEIKRHIKRSLKHYRIKRDHFVKILDAELSNDIEYSIPNGGLAFWIQFKEELDKITLEKHFAKHGISVAIMCDSKKRIGIRVGYATLSDNDMLLFANSLSQIIESNKLR